MNPLSAPPPGDDDLPAKEPGATNFNCPGCGEEVEVADEAIGQLARCPYCNSQFFASAEVIDQAVVDDTGDSAEDQAAREQELDVARIRNLSTLRRSAIRARSWFLIGAGVSIVAVIELLFETVQYVRQEHRWGLRPTSYVLFAIFAIWAMPWCLIRAKAMKKELQSPMLPEPEQPPDFSDLSDGSQHWKNLDDMH